jgi:hypothetical protein
MELTEDLKELFIKTAKVLTGSERRIFMARVVGLLGKGGQTRVERDLAWCRDPKRNS